MTITIYKSLGNEYSGPTYRLFDPHPALDSRPVVSLTAELIGLTLEDSQEEHGGLMLVDDNGIPWSILNAIAMGKLRILDA